MSLGELAPARGAQSAAADETGLRSTIIHTIKDYANAAPRSRQRAIGPSQVGTPCARQLAYQMSEVAPSRDIHDPWPSIVGTATHAWLADAMEHGNQLELIAGRPAPWHIERRVDVGFGLAGSCDVFHEPTGTVIDWKILGNTQYAKYTGSGPSETYETQAHCYGLGYLRAGFAVKRVAIGFFGRAKKLSDLHMWSEPFSMEKALLTLDRMRTVQQIISAGVEPIRIPPTPGGACFFCSYRGEAALGYCEEGK